MDEWIANFRHICQIDSYDGRHPNVFVPRPREHDEFRSIPDINNYLLRHDEVVDFIGARARRSVALFLTARPTRPPRNLRIRPARSGSGRRSAGSLGQQGRDRAPGQSRRRTERTQRAGPREELRRAASPGLGRRPGQASRRADALRRSGHTTFFISNKSDWRRHAAEIAREAEVKVMKRIEPLTATLEACATRCGTVAGPLLTEIVGHPELTPYHGGWAATRSSAAPSARQLAARRARTPNASAISSWLTPGYFDLDFLIDRDDGELYLGGSTRASAAPPAHQPRRLRHADVPLLAIGSVNRHCSVIPYRIKTKTPGAGARPFFFFLSSPAVSVPA